MSERDIYLNENASAFEECLELHKRVADLEAALRWLVDLKDGPRDEAYEQMKPKAWENARAALKGDDLDNRE